MILIFYGNELIQFFLVNTFHLQQKITNIKMKEKDPQSKQKLNETRISSDYIDNSYQNSILVNNTVIQASNAPLHSHYLYHKQQNSYDGNLRLLNPHHGSPRKAKPMHHQNKYNKKPAFGCSQVRKIQIFQGQDNKPRPAQYNPNLSILQKTFVKQKIRIQQRETQANKQNKQNNNLVPILKVPYDVVKTKLGFGIGSDFQRIMSLDSLLRRGNPGPGQYNIYQKLAVNQKKNKLACNKNFTLKQNNLKQMPQKDPGPGSYNLPTFTSQKQQFFEKQKWKQKFIQRKVKTKQFLEQINFQRQENKLKFQQQKIKTNNLNRYSEISQNKQQDQKHNKSLDLSRKPHKYLRNELRDLTYKYLPKMEEIVFSQHENRGPTYKHMLASSFASKNDHAYQAHYYKPPQKQSDYLFFKSKHDNIKPMAQNYCFKSTTARCQF